MNRNIAWLSASLLAGAGLVALTMQAQTAPSAAAELKASYARIKTNLMKAADKVPEDAFSFTPATTIRPFGALVGHVADAQMGTCSSLTGERKQGSAGSKTSKADLVAALKESFDACDKAYDALTDANAMESTGSGRGQRTRIGVLYGNVVHDNEMYGTMAVYMRAKGLVPPSSEGR